MTEATPEAASGRKTHALRSSEMWALRRETVFKTITSAPPAKVTSRTQLEHRARQAIRPPDVVGFIVDRRTDPHFTLRRVPEGTSRAAARARQLDERRAAKKQQRTAAREARAAEAAWPDGSRIKAA